MENDKKTRMALTISTELKEAIYDLGNGFGKPPATALVEMLEQMIPAMKMQAEMARAARMKDTTKFQSLLREMVGESASQILMASLPQEKKRMGRPRKNQGENNGND